MRDDKDQPISIQWASRIDDVQLIPPGCCNQAMSLIGDNLFGKGEDYRCDKCGREVRVIWNSLDQTIRQAMFVV